MTGKEILSLAESLTEGDTIDPVLGLKFINECLVSHLKSDAQVIDSVTISTLQDTWTSIPADLLEVFEIEKDGSPYLGARYGVTSRGEYDLRNGQIRFPEPGTYILWYYRIPKALGSLSETPEVHGLLHFPMAYYVASRHKSYDDEESTDAPRLLAEYKQFEGDALKEIAKLRPKTRGGRIVKASTWQ